MKMNNKIQVPLIPVLLSSSFMIYICHGRKSNLVEFQILPVESPVGVSTGRKFKINLVETPIGLSTGRYSNQGDLGIALGSEI